MSDKFTIISSTDEDKSKEVDHVYRIAKSNEVWGRQYRNAILSTMKKNKNIKVADYPQGDLMKIALCGIKYICSMRDVKRENLRLDTRYSRSLQESQIIFQLIDTVLTVCGCLTLKNFVTTFPIDKEYDGAKWGCKDYFYTMDVLSKMDWNAPIGRDNLSELLWDYMNNDLTHVYLEFTDAMSAIYRSETGKGIMEQFCEEQGIDTYTVDRENGIIKNNQTGNIGKIKKASHIQIIKQ